MKWLASFLSALLLVTLVLSGAHSHHGSTTPERTCVACTIAHAPMASLAVADSPSATEPTFELRVERPMVAVGAPAVALPSPRGPPLA